MLIGIPKEIKDHEFRVGATPAGVKTLVASGHSVLLENNAGAAIGYSNEMYAVAGAKIVATAAEVYAADLIVKVKEPQPAEWPLLREGQIVFGYLHLAPAPDLAATLLDRKIIAIAYETITDIQGATPLLTPMSEVAGRLSVQAGATALQMAYGGRGILLGGVPGVPPAKVVILGGGTVGANAAKIAIGMGADVTLLDINHVRLRQLDDMFGARLKTCYADPHATEELVRDADLVIGAVYLPGRRAPKLISRACIASMRPGSVLVDVCIDQGGCSETSRPTTHSNPLYMDEGVVHYCVSNMPAAVARTSTQALTQVTLFYVLQLANQGWQVELRNNPALRSGLNLYRGKVTHAAVAEDLGYPYFAPELLLDKG
jgi:alanine dehydrogenase